ncbi:MAG TPA: hypothetical protein PKD79_02945 [Candidatus Doudnabacteria bacterium]|nr:hypothetical protein [Candidatus Doudnabacteria bacterium]
MSINAELDSMMKVANVLRFIVVVLRNYFLRENQAKLLWAFPVCVPMTTQIAAQIANLSVKQLEILDDVLEEFGAKLGKDIKLEVEQGEWFIIINLIVPDIDPGPEGDDDFEPRPAYEKPPLVMAASGR